jgi:hypothetical protein
MRLPSDSSDWYIARRIVSFVAAAWTSTCCARNDTTSCGLSGGGGGGGGCGVSTERSDDREREVLLRGWQWQWSRGARNVPVTASKECGRRSPVDSCSSTFF